MLSESHVEQSLQHDSCSEAREASGAVDLDGPLGDSPARTVLYDPEQPRRALRLEELPAWVRIAPDGVGVAEDDPKKSPRRQ